MKILLRIIMFILFIVIAYINTETKIEPTSKLILTIAGAISALVIYFLEDTIINHFRGRTHINGNNARKDAINDKYISNKVSKRYDNPEIIGDGNHGVRIPIDKQIINKFVSSETIYLSREEPTLLDYKHIKSIIGVRVADFIKDATWFAMTLEKNYYSNEEYVVIRYKSGNIEVRKCK